MTPLTLGGAGLLVAWTAGLLAAWGIFAVGAQLRGRRTGVVLAALWGVYPTAFVQSMAYTETLFTALAAWALYAVLRGRWIVAGALCVLAGLTRPTAAALIAALAITAAVTLVREYREERRGRPGAAPQRPDDRGRGARTAGLAGVRGVRGRPRGQPVRLLRRPGAVGQQHRRRSRARRLHQPSLPWPAALGLCAALGLLGWLVVLCVRQRQPLPVLVYALTIVVISLIGAGYFGSRPRLMMPAFPLLLPPAVVLLRLRTTGRTAAVLAVLACASAAYGAWTLLGPGPP